MDRGAQNGRAFEGEAQVRPIEHGLSAERHAVRQLAAGILDRLSANGGDGHFEVAIGRLEEHRGSLRHGGNRGESCGHEDD